MWMSMIADGHDCICNCNSPFGHLLASIFPPGHQDRFLTVEEIINRDIKECHSGGDGDGGHGSAAGEDIKRDIPEEEGAHFIKDEELDALIAAGEDAGGR